MKNKKVCPECKSTNVKRLIFEWSVPELIGIVLFIVYTTYRFVKPYYSTRPDYLDAYEWNFGITVGIIALIIFPILLNLRFPRYKCKTCKKKFKPNGEDAEDVFADY